MQMLVVQKQQAAARIARPRDASAVDTKAVAAALSKEAALKEEEIQRLQHKEATL
eukprot:SAG31_NODE_15914_length_732_cov_0.805687_1_plen_54_part_01